MRPGPTTHWLWVRGVQAWGPVTNPTARALACWLGALCGRHEGAWGERLLPGCRASGVGRSHTPDHSSFRACSGGPLPTGCGCGGCGRGDRSPTSQRAILQAGFVRCGGGMRVPRGGASCLGAGRPGSGAIPPLTTRPFGRAADGPLPTGCGCGGCGRGDPSPNPQRALLLAGFASCAGGMSMPGEGASCLGVGRSGSGALPPPTPPPFVYAAGAHYPLAVGAGGSGVGTRHQPHRARSCELALHAVGAARGHLGGAPLAWVQGVRGRALSIPRPPVLWGVQPGPATHWLWVRRVRAWGPVTNPTARPIACWVGTMWGRHEGARGGRLLPGCGASEIGRSPTPDHSSFRACGWGLLLTCHGCCVRAFGCGCPPHLPRRRGSSCVVRASRVCGTRWPLWPAACLSGVPRGPASVRRASSSPVALRALVGFPVAVEPSPTPGAVAPGFTWWLRGARGGQLRTWFFVPAAGPCQGKGAGRAPRRTRSEPRDGVVPGGSLRLRAWAACAAVVWRGRTRSLTRPVSRTVRPSTEDSAPAPGLFRVGAVTTSFGSEEATPGSRACVCACSS